ncbi:MAG TPA: beta-galactosidase [Gaiellaceae bacterium]|jgi:hypothetical protein|nr:beta-galactosidase [Gaiellaceae bacterium]
MRRLLLLAAFGAALLIPSSAAASPYVRYGVQDDAWLEYGPGTLSDRFDELQSLGVDVVRVTVDWNVVEPRKGVFNWAVPDEVIDGLHARGIAPLVTLYGAPRWANGDRTANWAPTSGSTFAAFARTAAERYPFVHLWTIWNEPNQVRSLRPTSPKVYVQRLLNPAYAAIHAVSPSSQVAGGVTAPRGAAGGVSPVAWIAGMAAAHAKLDAYAHNPYPLSPQETPTSGACKYCTTITMASLNRLLVDVKNAFGTKTRIWLTEYGYQTNPPDTLLGVSYAKQATYISEAALRAHDAPRVDILIQYLVEDEPNLARWQSGLYTTAGRAKPALEAFRFPLAERSRTGTRTVLWGQVRPGGAGTYKLLRYADGSWNAVGGVARTTARGYFTRTVNAARGTRYRIWIPSQQTYSAILTVT